METPHNPSGGPRGRRGSSGCPFPPGPRPRRQARLARAPQRTGRSPLRGPARALGGRNIARSGQYSLCIIRAPNVCWAPMTRQAPLRAQQPLVAEAPRRSAASGLVRTPGSVASGLVRAPGSAASGLVRTPGSAASGLVQAPGSAASGSWGIWAPRNLGPSAESSAPRGFRAGRGAATFSKKTRAEGRGPCLAA